MKGYHTHLQENDDLPQAIKKKLPFFTVCASIMHEIMCSKNVQCNTKE